MNDNPDDIAPLGPQLSDELKQFAAELTRLRPRDDRLDRERLAFLAGQASVAAKPTRRVRLLGIPLESRAWPGAFAAMTSIAAALFVALLMRPDISTVRPTVAAGGAHDVAKQFVNERRDQNGVLSTQDARLGDMETRLAELQRSRGDRGAASTPDDHSGIPVLTPNAWHQLINETESARPSQRDATGLMQNQGVNS
jgi:hypothetical protein